MKDTILISIIVPVYNVELYLKRCVDSLINQTYRNLEIILVDDGSPDYCGEICDEYANIDNRIKVVHKDNAGLSEARNTGIEQSKGDFLFFIDSDDWIEKETCESVLQNAVENHSDLVVFGVRDYYPSGKTREFPPYKAGIVEKTECMKALIYNMHYYGIFNYACNKMYSRELIEGERFTKGRLSEDHAFVYKIIHKSKVISICDGFFYNYYRREGSISNRLFYPQLIMGRNQSWMERLSFIKLNYPELEDLQLAQIIGDTYISSIKLKNNQEYQALRLKMLEFAKQYRSKEKSLAMYSKRIKLHYYCYPLFWLYAKYIVK